MMCLYWIIFGFYLYTLALVKQQVGVRLMSIAATAAAQIDADDLEPLRFARDMKREEYQRVFTQLNMIRNKNPDIKYVYILRPTMQHKIWEFVVDADSNFYIPFDEIDYNQDGELNDSDENVAPGIHNDISLMSSNDKEWLIRPWFEKEFSLSQWGWLLTANAPIYNSQNVASTILALDIDVTDVKRNVSMQFMPLLSIIALLLLIQILGIFYSKYRSN